MNKEARDDDGVGCVQAIMWTGFGMLTYWCIISVFMGVLGLVLALLN